DDHPFARFPWRALRRPLRGSERREFARSLCELLRFQRSLGGLTPPRTAPDATPFVSLYADGVLRGCYGSDEGGRGERLARAFLRAAHDARFGGIGPAERGALVAQVSYARSPRLLHPETAADEIEVGTPGVPLVRDGAPPVLLLPHVARDERAAPGDYLRALARKAGLAADGRIAAAPFGRAADGWRDGALYAFETDDVVVRPSGASDGEGAG